MSPRKSIPGSSKYFEFSSTYLSIQSLKIPIRRGMFSPILRHILILIVASLQAIGAFAVSETATPNTRPTPNSSTSATTARIPSTGQCPESLLDWVRDDKKDKKFFLVFPLKSEQNSVCRNALDSNKTSDVNDLRNTFRETFSDRFKDTNLSPIQNCALPNGEEGVHATSKYFAALRRIDEGLSRVMDESAAINATMPNTPFDESFCGSVFKTHRDKCATYKKACQNMASADEFEALAKDAAIAASKVFCVNLVDQNCRYNGGGKGLVQILKSSSSPQLRQCIGILSKDATDSVLANADDMQTVFCDAKKNKQVVEQTIGTYPFMFGEEFKKLVDPTASVRPIISKLENIKGYSITGPAAGKFPFDPKQVQKAISNQLSANREGLKQTKKDFESAYYCLTGQKVSNQASNDNCSPEFLNKVTNGVYMPEDDRIRGDGKRRSAIDLYQCQQNLIEIHTERDKLSSMSSEGLKTIGITGISMLTGGLAAPAAVSRISSLSRMARLAAGATIVGGEAYVASDSVRQAIDACFNDKPKAALSLAQNRALEEGTCPAQSTSASQGVRLATSCYLDSAFGLTDTLSAGLASAATRNLKNAVTQTEKEAQAAARAADSATIVRDPKSEIGTSGMTRPERRHPEVAHTSDETSKYHRSASRQQAVDEYAHKQLSSPTQNKAWLQSGSKVTPDGKTWFLDIQNTKMKQLNDTTLDKDLITSITHMHQEKSMKGIEDLLKNKYPNVEVKFTTNHLDDIELAHFVDKFPQVRGELKQPMSDQMFKDLMKKYPEIEGDLSSLYVDFKTLRYAFSPKPPLQQIPKKFREDLNQTLMAINDDFAKMVQERQLVREANEANTWFRFGYGETGDQANIATRYARDQGENRLYSFTEQRVQRGLARTMTDAEGYRNSLSRSLGKTDLWDKEAGRQTLRVEVFELARKAQSPEDLKKQIQLSLGTNITTEQADEILKYSKSIDTFSPGINIVNRETASLTPAKQGGIIIDFKGMGGQNLKETAEALANQRSVARAVEEARLGENAVTTIFNVKKDAIRSVAEKAASKYGLRIAVKASGDDMVLIPDKPFTKEMQDQIAQEIAKVMNPSSIRMSSIPAGVPENGRAMLGVTGESIEKQLRKNLQGEIPREKLDQILFRVDMTLPGSSTTTATLNTTTGGSTVTAEEKKKIEKAFQEALEAMKKKPSSRHWYRPRRLSPEPLQLSV